MSKNENPKKLLPKKFKIFTTRVATFLKGKIPVFSTF
jgi:hypothetical protein